MSRGASTTAIRRMFHHSEQPPQGKVPETGQATIARARQRAATGITRLAAYRPQVGGGIGSLRDGMPGCWQVVTQTAVYVIDLDDRSVMRTPLDPEIASRAAGHDGIVVSAFSDDRRFVRLARLVDCAVGQRMRLYTEAEPTLVQLRISTSVRAIRRLS